ncbi:MAG: hypothetical protein ABEH90_03160 [Halolamina sp.]
MSSNPDERTLERRLAAVERAVNGTDNAGNPADCAESPSPEAREPLEERLGALEARVDELDAALQAVRGFLGGVDAVNEEVETRADAAVAAVERLERRLDEAHIGADSREDGENPAEPTVADLTPTDSNGEALAEPTATDPAGDTEERTLRKRLSERW